MKTLDELRWELAHAEQQWDNASYYERTRPDRAYWLERINEIRAEIESRSEAAE
jgi:hypothetical protein